MNYPPSDVPAFVFWPMPDEDPLHEVWPASTSLHSWQRGRCGMCEVDVRSDRRLVMDHDHTTGKIRGLLCRSCNACEPYSTSAAWSAWRSGLTPAATLGIDEDYAHLLPGTHATEVALRAPISDALLDAIADAAAGL